MPTTDRFGIRYPSMSDPPDGPGAFEKLAKDTDVLLSRAWVCTSATRPSSPGQGFLIYEFDTGLVLIYRGAQWRVIASSDEVSTEHRSYNDASQTLQNNTSPILSFPKDTQTSPLVTKVVASDGHTFTLNRGGRWALTATCRFNLSSGGESYIALLWNGLLMTADGGPMSGQRTTRNLSLTRRISSGGVITVQAFQSSGAALITQPSVDGWVNFTAEWLGP